MKRNVQVDIRTYFPYIKVCIALCQYSASKSLWSFIWKWNHSLLFLVFKMKYYILCTSIIFNPFICQTSIDFLHSAKPYIWIMEKSIVMGIALVLWYVNYVKSRVLHSKRRIPCHIGWFYFDWSFLRENILKSTSTICGILKRSC